MNTKLLPIATIAIALLAGWHVAGEWLDEENTKQQIAQSPESRYPATKKAYRPKQPTTSRWANMPTPAKNYDDNWEIKPMPREMPSWLKSILVLVGIIGGFIGVILLASFAPHVLFTMVVAIVLIVFWLMIKEEIDRNRNK